MVKQEIKEIVFYVSVMIFVPALLGSIAISILWLIE
jgi:hypothetical protein